MLIKFEVNMKLSVICLICLLPERLEQVLDTIRGKCRLAKDAHNFKDGPASRVRKRLSLSISTCPLRPLT
mgnify:CR=1 FL=1